MTSCFETFRTVHENGSATADLLVFRLETRLAEMLPTDKGSQRRETVWGVLGRRAGAGSQ